jgi:hypothetical protein
MTPAEAIDLIIARAAKLRAAGVLHVKLRELEFTIGPDPIASSALPAEDEEPDDLNPLEDPETFGRRRGQPVPRGRRRGKSEPSEPDGGDL